jgi:ABC-2 type transport system permease protein
MNQSITSALAGVVRYEFAMQIRRPSLWIAYALLGALALFQFTHDNNYTHDANLTVTRANITLIEAAGAAGFLAFGVGLLFAGRVRRDHTTRVEETLRTTPASLSTRLFGKYLGAVLATLTPIALIYMAGFAVLMIRWQDASIAPLALAAFAAFVLPSALFVAAFSIACGTFMWTPLYQFLFVGYWLWNSLDPAGPIPTLNATVLDPTERLVMTGIFGFTPFRTTDLSYYPQASLWLGAANIVTLLGAATLALVVAWLIQRWRVDAE